MTKSEIKITVLQLRGKLRGMLDKKAGIAENVNCLYFATDTYWYRYFKREDKLIYYPRQDFPSLSHFSRHVSNFVPLQKGYTHGQT